jgi:hypothetical protein
MWAVSDARLVLMPKYEKDDVREAVRIAAAADKNGARVLWVADTYAAEYYGVTALRSDRHTQSVMKTELDCPVTLQAIDGQNWSSDAANRFIDSSASPTVLVVSRPDLFDKQGVWRQLVEVRHASKIASLPAFSIYLLEATANSPSPRRISSNSKVSRCIETRLIGHTPARLNNL